MTRTLLASSRQCAHCACRQAEHVLRPAPTRYRRSSTSTLAASSNATIRRRDDDHLTSRDDDATQLGASCTSNRTIVKPSHRRVFQRALNAAFAGLVEQQRQQELTSFAISSAEASQAQAHAQSYRNHGFHATPRRASNSSRSHLLNARVRLVSSSSLSSSSRTFTHPKESRRAWSSTANMLSDVKQHAQGSDTHDALAPLLANAISHAPTLDGVTRAAFGSSASGEEVHFSGGSNAPWPQPEAMGALSPGCWIESMRNGVPLDGVLLGRAEEGHGRVLILSSLGVPEYQVVTQDAITCVIPDFVSSTLAHRCRLLDPANPVALPLLQDLRQLAVQVEAEMRSLIALGAHRIYALCRSSNGKRTFINCQDALELLGYAGGYSPKIHLAMHRVLIQDSEHFIADPISMRTTGRFYLRPPEEVELLTIVRGWVRDRAAPLVAFANRAAKVRQEGLVRSHKYDAKVRVLAPTALPHVTWTQSDRRILEFLRHATRTSRALQLNPYLSTAPFIFKFVDDASLALGGSRLCETNKIDRERMLSLLAEIGVLAPWEDWVALEAHELLKPWDDDSAQLEKQFITEDVPAVPRHGPRVASNSTSPARPTTSTARETSTVDGLDTVRRDFGSLAVYTIDDVGAMELDDGISIEPATPQANSRLSSWWIHVHIADPTSIISPHHAIFKRARDRVQTEYFPERTWSMLPEVFVNGKNLSLGALQGGEQRTLSFSMRIDEEGEVLESSIAAGIVRNVQRYTYSAVNDVLGHQAAQPPAVIHYPRLPFDQSRAEPRGQIRRPTENERLKTDASAQKDLAVLHRLARAMLRRRADNDALYWQFPKASVSVSPAPTPTWQTPSQPSFYDHAPLVSLRLPPSTSSTSLDPAQTLVSEAMIAANRAAARFSVETGLAMPFRVQDAPRVAPTSSLAEVLALRDPETGEASPEDVLRLGVDFLPGTTQAEPGVHWPMGVRDAFGYVRVTSPLRRYSDLFSHWQLKSALRPCGESAPAFSRSEVLAHLRDFDLAQKERGRLSKNAEAFWALFVVRNRFDAARRSVAIGEALDEDDAFTNLFTNGVTAVALRASSRSDIENVWRQPVLLRELGLQGVLTTSTLGASVAVGESARAKISDVQHRIIVERY